MDKNRNGEENSPKDVGLSIKAMVTNHPQTMHRTIHDSQTDYKSDGRLVKCHKLLNFDAIYRRL